MPNPHILVLSLDFDGCSDRDFSQDAIVQHVLDAYADVPKVIMMIGSLRQSLNLDVQNAMINSSFPHYISCTSLAENMLPKLKDALSDVQFDTFLQQDIFAQLDSGTTFSNMQKVFLETPAENLKNIEEEPLSLPVRDLHGEDIELFSAPHMIDTSKITILYGQMHHLASQHSDIEILMHFYDDRVDILEAIHIFYQVHPQWIPSNLNLQLFCQRAVEGYQPQFYGNALQGRGKINTQYRKTLDRLAKKLSHSTLPTFFPAMHSFLKNAVEPLEFCVMEEKLFPESYCPEPSIRPEKAILDILKIESASEQRLSRMIQEEHDHFNAYLMTLKYLKVNPLHYETLYQIQAILQKPVLSHQNITLLNEKSMLLQHIPKTSKEMQDEIENYAETKCWRDYRIEQHHQAFNQHLKDVSEKFSQALHISKEVLIQRVLIFKRSKFKDIKIPIARRDGLFRAPTSAKEEPSFNLSK